MKDKIMNRDSLEYTLCRLICCAALFDVLRPDIAGGKNYPDALAGACYLLESIIEDFRENISNAKNYDGKAVQS